MDKRVTLEDRWGYGLGLVSIATGIDEEMFVAGSESLRGLS